MNLSKLKSLHLVNFAAILAGLAIVVTLSALVANRMQNLRAAPVDNAQWNMSQLEVDFLKLHAASTLAQVEGEPQLAEMRKRYDAFYSRVNVIEKSSGTARVHSNPILHHKHELLKAFLGKTVQHIDGSDAELLIYLPEFMVLLDEIQDAVRDLAISGIEISSEIAEEKRQEIVNLLGWVAAATPLTILALFAALFRQNMQRAELKKRSIALASANRRFNSTLSASLDAIVVVNENGIITDYNGSAEAVFGHAQADAVGKRMVDLIIPHQYREAHSDKFSNYVSDGKSGIVDAGRLELEALHADSRIFPIEVSISETIGESGPNFVSYIRDITQQRKDELELKQARDEALRAFQDKSKFVAVMSHEMRTPLNGITSSLDLLKDGDLNEKQSRYVELAERSSRILLEHINDVLQIERLDSGDREVEIEPFDLNDFAPSLLDSLRPLADQSMVQLRHVHEGATNLVFGDQRALRQVLTNLIGNAIKYSSSGEVILRTKSSAVDGNQANVKFAVEDSGIGISKNDQEHIFDDFVTLGSPYERTTTGTGLGLGIARRLVNRMGGALTCESDVGKGSTFAFEVALPVASRLTKVTTSKKVTSDSYRVDALNILLVEDNLINRELLSAMIEREGHHVALAENGFEGVLRAAEARFDLILMDISMPNMNGIEATQKIRTSNSVSSKSPIYAVTAHAMADEIEEFHKAGMDGSLIKPIQVDKLRELLGRIGASQINGSAAIKTKKHSAEVQGDMIDKEQFDEIISVLGHEKAASMLGAFVAEGRDATAKMEPLAASGNLSDLRALAHKWAGSCGTFGATELRSQLHKIERACKENDNGEVIDLINDIGPVWQATRAAFKSTTS